MVRSTSPGKYTSRLRPFSATTTAGSLVGEERDVRQQQGGILRKIVWRELLLVHEVEEETSFQQRIVHPVDVLRHQRSAWRRVEQLRPLAHHDADVRDRSSVDEMRLVL